MGSTGTIGDDGRFVPDPPGASIFSPASVARRPDAMAAAKSDNTKATAERATKTQPVMKATAIRTKAKPKARKAR